MIAATLVHSNNNILCDLLLILYLNQNVLEKLFVSFLICEIKIILFCMSVITIQTFSKMKQFLSALLETNYETTLS